MGLKVEDCQFKESPFSATREEINTAFDSNRSCPTLSYFDPRSTYTVVYQKAGGLEVWSEGHLVTKSGHTVTIDDFSVSDPRYEEPTPLSAPAAVHQCDSAKNYFVRASEAVGQSFDISGNVYFLVDASAQRHFYQSNL